MWESTPKSQNFSSEALDLKEVYAIAYQLHKFLPRILNLLDVISPTVIGIKTALMIKRIE